MQWLISYGRLANQRSGIAFLSDPDFKVTGVHRIPALFENLRLL